MTVNHVLRVHPLARAVFRAFDIDCADEGCSSVEELAWRRGVDVEALLLALNQSLGAGRAASPVPGLAWNACDGMMIIDERRRVLAINPSMERLIGRPSRDVVGTAECGLLLDCQDAQGCPLADHPAQCPGLRAMHQIRAVRSTEYTIQTAAGRRVTFNASYTPIQPKVGGPVWALVILRNASLQQRRLRQAQRRPQSVVTPSWRLGERRRHQRVRLAAPIVVREVGTGRELLQEGLIENLSLSGAFGYFTVPFRRPIAVDEMLMVSIAVPPERQREFPFSRLAGPARVVRVEPPVALVPPEQKRVGLALAFGEDLIMLRSSAGNGH
jgi:PAS domain-containing protein